jgi:hypothetical protein
MAEDAPEDQVPEMKTARKVEESGVGSSDFDIFLEIQYVSCVFGLALIS